MAKKSAGSVSVPVTVRSVYEQIVRLTDQLCREHLNEEYALLARSMAEVLSRKRPSPFSPAKPRRGPPEFSMRWAG